MKEVISGCEGLDKLQALLQQLQRALPAALTALAADAPFLSQLGTWIKVSVLTGAQCVERNEARN